MNGLRQRKGLSYFLPFIILVFSGIILVMIIQLTFFFWKEKKTASQDFRLYAVSSGGQLLPWGKEEPTFLKNGQIFLEGDAVQTDQQGKIVLLYEDQQARLGSNSHLLFTVKTDKEKIWNLKQGKLWVDKMDKVILATSEMRIFPKAAVFAVEKGEKQMVRVLEGEVQVQILGNNQVDDFNTFNLEKGKQLIFSGVPTSFPLIENIGADFWEEEFYQWNINFKEDPTKISNSAGLKLEDPAEEGEPVLKIIYPLNELEIQGDKIKIKGTASKEVDRIKVQAEGSFGLDVYQLKNYRSGDQTWSYLASFSLKNLAEGENRYTIVAIDQAGREIDKKETVVKVVSN